MVLQYGKDERYRREQQILNGGTQIVTHIRPMPRFKTRVGTNVRWRNGYTRDSFFLRGFDATVLSAREITTLDELNREEKAGLCYSVTEMQTKKWAPIGYRLEVLRIAVS